MLMLLSRLCVLSAWALSAVQEARTAAAPPGPTQNLTSEASIDQLLDAMDLAGRDLRDFHVVLTLTETDEVTGDSTRRAGQAWYEGGAEPRLRAVFPTRTVGGRTIDDKREYALEGEWLTDRDHRRKVEVRRQVRRPGEKTNLFRLGEGPFPLPIGQKKEDVHRQFEVLKPPLMNSDPENSVRIRLKPRPDTRFAKRVSIMDIWVDLATGLPRRIVEVSADGATTRQADFDSIKVNQGVNAADLRPEPIDEKAWQRHTEKFEG